VRELVPGLTMVVTPPIDAVRSTRAGGTTRGVAVVGASPVSVTRIGTQVVVRLSGTLDDRHAACLAAAVDEVSELVLRRVVVDLDDVDHLAGAGLAFLDTLHERWTVRLLNAPAGLRRGVAARPA
jgi:ABC-type transporter Mla MlaB component